MSGVTRSGAPSVSAGRDNRGAYAIGNRARAEVHEHNYHGDVVFHTATLAPGFARRLQQYSDFYLGTTDKPAPFGGRGSQIFALDRWVNDSDAPRRLLLWAPAGRGKSALLAHWTASHAGDRAIVFVPISIRFATADELTFHLLLASQLAAVVGEGLPMPSDATALMQCREWCLEYLYRLREVDRSVLIVIDGLDEATGWNVDSELLRNVPENTRVVASARLQRDDTDARGWRTRLGWPVRLAADMEVPRLDLAGIREALVSMGAPLDRLSEPAPVARELLRLTEGDPLLLGFYVADLWGDTATSAKLRPEDLARLEKGLAGYFRNWVNTQEPQWRSDAAMVNAALQVLSAALGPLPHADLAELVRRHLRDDGAQVSAETLEPLRRFLIGDAVDGYAFNHPRLARYVREDYFCDPELAKQVDRIFAEWGLATVALLNGEKLPSGDVSRYLLRHLSTHLIGSQTTPELVMTLVENGWRRAWLGFEGGERGFAQDVQRCAKALPTIGTTDQPVLAWRVRCALVLSSIGSVGRKISPALLATAVKARLMPALQALYLLQLRDDNDRTSGLTVLAELLPEALLADALAIAREIADAKSRAAALGALASRAPEAWPEVLAAVRAIPGEATRTEALVALAERLPDALAPEALAAAWAIPNDRLRPQLLAALAPRLPDSLVAEALAGARAIPNEDYRAQALATLAPRSPEVWLEALATVGSIGYPYFRADALAALAERLPQALVPEALAAARALRGCRAKPLAALAARAPEVWPEALAAAREFGLDWEAVVALAPRVPEALLPEALWLARAIWYADARVDALGALAVRLPEAWPEALAAVRHITKAREAAKALATMAEHLPAALLPEAAADASVIEGHDRRAVVLAALARRAPGLWPEAVAAACAASGGLRGDALAALAPLLPEAFLPIALSGARTIEGVTFRLEALQALALRAPEVWPEVLATARGIGDESERLEALAALAECMPEALIAAMALARAVGDESARAEALAALAECLPQASLEALAAARAIPEGKDRALALAALASRAPKAWPEALVAVRAIPDASDRRQVLVALAERLPDALRPEALAVARAIPDEPDRAQALAALASDAHEVWAEALTAARAISDECARSHALVALAGRLPAALLREALAASRTIADGSFRADVLTALAERMPEALVPEALAATRALRNKSVRAKPLAVLVARMPGGWSEALAAARALEFDSEVLLAMVPRVPEVLLPEALLAARTAFNSWEVLAALAPRLPEALLPKALAAARAIRHEPDRAIALAALAARAPRAWPEALAAARAAQSQDMRAQALTTLAACLPEAWPDAVAAVRAIEDEAARARALAGLAKGLPEVLVPEALGVAQMIGGAYARAIALAALARRVPEAWLEAAAAVRVIRDQSDLAEALAALAWRLVGGLEMAGNEWHILVDEVARVRRDYALLFIRRFLIPLERNLEGEVGLTVILRAIGDTATWFP